MSLVVRPRLRVDHEERAATPLELFFDLVFVVAIAQLAHGLGDHLTPAGAAQFVLLFVPVWWSWAGYTNFADRFDTDDVVHRGLMLLGMLAMAFVAVNVGHATEAAVPFALSYVALRTVLIVLYLRVRSAVPEVRRLVDVTAGVFTVGTALWLVSVAVPAPARYVIWGVAVGIEVLTPWVARRAMAVPMHASHLAERYGLFTIIVLGESVFGVVTGVDGTAWGGAAAATAVLGFVVAAGAWWLYFALAGRMEFGRSVAVRNTFVYGHLAIAVGLAAAGTGIKLAILRAPADELGTGPTWALAGGTALFLLTTALLAAVVARRPAPRPVVAGRTLAGALALLLAALGGGLPALAVTAVLAVLVVGVAAAELAAVPAVRPSGEPLVETGRA